MGAASVDKMFERGSSNREWLNGNFREVRRNYGGQYVAIENEKVIASSPDPEKIAEVVNEKAEHPESAIIKFIAEEGKKILR